MSKGSWLAAIAVVMTMGALSSGCVDGVMVDEDVASSEDALVRRPREPAWVDTGGGGGGGGGGIDGTGPGICEVALAECMNACNRFPLSLRALRAACRAECGEQYSACVQ